MKPSFFSVRHATRFLLILGAGLAGGLAVEARDAESGPLKPRFSDASKTLWLEPKQGVFLPVSLAENSTAKRTFSLRSKKQANGIFAVYESDGNLNRDALPRARYKVHGLKVGSPANRVEVTLELKKNGDLNPIAKDLADRSNTLTVSRLTREEALAASLPPTNGTAGLPAIAEREGKTLEQSVGLRSSNGLFVPFLRAGAPIPDEPVTVTMRPTHPGQRTGELIVYEGENHFIENDKVLAHYLIAGLSTSKNAKFRLRFKVNSLGKVYLDEASDTSTTKRLKVIPYSSSAASRLRREFPAEATPTQVPANWLMPSSPVATR